MLVQQLSEPIYRLIQSDNRIAVHCYGYLRRHEIRRPPVASVP